MCIVVFIAITVGYLLYHYNEHGSTSDGLLIWKENETEQMYMDADVVGEIEDGNSNNLYQG